MAMLIHLILRSYKLIKPALDSFRTSYYNPLLYRSYFEDSPEIKDRLSELLERENFSIPQDILTRISKFVFQEIYLKELPKEMYRSFLSPLSDLIHIGRSHFQLDIDLPGLESKIRSKDDSIEIIQYPQTPDIALYFELDNTVDSLAGYSNSGSKTFSLRYSHDFIQNSERLFEIIFSFLLNAVEDKSVNSFYLPAARSELMQSYRALLTGLLYRAPYAGRGAAEIPVLSGIVSDFLVQLISLPRRSSTPFSNLVKEFQNELIKGEVKLNVNNKLMDYNIRYFTNSLAIPLERASSSVSELAPLILYLENIISPGNLLIIEEPEAHLHPRNQITLAKFMVRLIHKGVYIVVTTHFLIFPCSLCNSVCLSTVLSPDFSIVLDISLSTALSFSGLTL